MAIGGGSNDIEITVKVDDNGASTVFDKLGNQIDAAEAKAKTGGQAFDGLSGTLITLNQGAQLVGAALGALAGSFDTVIAGIKRGAEVDDITVSFENLTAQAGVAGDALLTSFGDALGNTIPKLDQMKQANELLLGGIDPSKFDLLAKAARSIGEATGQSAAEGMNVLSDSLLKGNDRALKTLGIVVDNEKAIRDFEKANGVLTGTLNEQGKVMAQREAVLKALEGAQEKLGNVTDDAADKFDQFTSTLTNASDAFFKAVANNKELNEALTSLVASIQNVDFTAMAAGLANIATLAINATTAIINATNAFVEFARVGGGMDQTLNSVGTAIGVIPDAVDEFDHALERVIRMLEKDTPEATRSAIAEFSALEKIGMTGDATFRALAKGGLDKTRIAVQEAAKAHGIGQKAIEGVIKVTKPLITGITDTAKAHELASKAGAKSAEEMKKLSAAISGATGVDKFPLLTRQIEEAFAQENVIGAEGVAKALEAIGVAALKANIPVEEIAKHIQDVSKLPLFGPGNADGLKEFQEIQAQFLESQKQFGDQLQDTLASALGDALTSAVDGTFNRADLKASIQGLGASMGSELGMAVGGPFGAAFGQALGSIYGKYASKIADIGKSAKGTQSGTTALVDLMFPGIGTAINSIIGGSLFGGDSASESARKAADKFFADAFDANRLSVVIGDQVQQIKDLVFKGDSLFGDAVSMGDGPTTSLFAALLPEAQAAFAGVGAAFEQFLGVSEEMGGQLGEVFVNNIGGSLNNLQLLVQATGVSFEQLKTSVVDAFLNGELAANEAANALTQVANIAQQGIPDGLGMVAEAFHNLTSASVKDGRVLVDALGDIGAEAKELGIKDFAQLRQHMINVGISAGDVDKLLSALTSNGIDGVDELTSATAEQLIPVLGQLQNVKFPFNEELSKATSEANTLIDTVKNLPSEIRTKVIIDVETNDPSGSLDKVAVAAGTAGRSFTPPSTQGRA